MAIPKIEIGPLRRGQIKTIPRLTTISQHIAAGARAMVSALFERIAGRDAPSVEMTPELIRRCEAGHWPTELWAAIEASGFAVAAAPESLGGSGASWGDLYGVVKATGRHNLPLPLPETMLANWLLGQCGLEARNEPLGIAMLNADAVAQSASAEGRAALESSLSAHIKSINATLDPHERLQCLVVVTTAWTVDNDVITPTFKVKRNRIEDLYARHYETWEASGQTVIWQ